MLFIERLKLSLIAGTISALLISGSMSAVTGRSLFFSHIFFGTAIDRKYAPEQEEKDEVVFGCWIFEFFSKIFS